MKVKSAVLYASPWILNIIQWNQERQHNALMIILGIVN